ncbi:MAG: type II secretion system protein M [Myxococcaceae bacterium]|nr:type II secretion system protein M [Myxococcaceae bacterium]MBH2006480.1 type II secretion system protein M [Myxococcaceae bacterium]
MRLEVLWDRFQALNDQHKKRVAGLIGLFFLMIVVLIIGCCLSSISARQQRIRQLDQEMRQITELATKYQQIKDEQQKREAKIRSNQVALFTLVQNAATRLDLKVNDLNERREPLAHSNLTQISVVVTVKELSMDRLTAFLEELEHSSGNELVKITRLQVKARFDSPDLLDVQLTVSTWKAE